MEETARKAQGILLRVVVGFAHWPLILVYAPRGCVRVLAHPCALFDTSVCPIQSAARFVTPALSSV